MKLGRPTDLLNEEEEEDDGTGARKVWAGLKARAITTTASSSGATRLDRAAA